MHHLCRAAALSMCLALCLTGCSASAAGDRLPSAPPERELTLYTSHPESIYAPYVREFEDRTGIWVRVVTGGSQELLDRILSEQSAPAADVMFGGGVESLEGCRDCFASYRSSQLSAITRAGFTGPDNRWTGFSALPLVFIYNTRLVSERDAPTTWQSLLDTKWQGRIAFVSPQVSGSCYTALSTAVQLYGEDYLTQFARNLGGVLLSESGEIASRVASGSCSVGVTLESTARRTMADGADIAYLYPEDGTSAVPDGVAVLAGAPHPQSAREFVDFVLSRDAQGYLSSALNRRSVRSDIPLEGLQKLENIHLISYDVDWAARKKPELLALWAQSFGAAGEEPAA